MAQTQSRSSEIVQWIPPFQFLPVPIPRLPNDVIIEILTWLPVKPLLRFKCVCKSWRALISSQVFIRAHLENSKSHPNLSHDMVAFNCICNLRRCSVNSMLYDSVSEVFDLSLPFESLRRSRVVSTCNGLILLKVDCEKLFMWNPSTRACKKLPSHIGVEIDYDSDDDIDYDLGYAKSSDDYKVLGVRVRNMDLSEVIVLVYSLRNDQWKRIKNINGLNVSAGRGAFANGKLYWKAYPDYNYGPGWDILSLDLEDEEYEILQMPSYVKIGEDSSLGVSEGSLYLLTTHRTFSDVWILDGGSVGTASWTKVVTIPHCSPRSWKPLRMLLYVLKNGLVMFYEGPTFVVYDAKDCSFRYPRIRNSGESLSVGIYTYVESLMSPVGWC